MTLIIEDADQIVGQITFDLESTAGANCDLWVSSVFVSAERRGEGFGAILGHAALDVAEAWRRSLASENGLDCEGGIDVSGDTLPGSGGERVIAKMEEMAMMLDRIAYDEARQSIDMPTMA